MAILHNDFVGNGLRIWPTYDYEKTYADFEPGRITEKKRPDVDVLSFMIVFYPGFYIENYKNSGWTSYAKGTKYNNKEDALDHAELDFNMFFSFFSPGSKTTITAFVEFLNSLFYLTDGLFENETNEPEYRIVIQEAGR